MRLQAALFLLASCVLPTWAIYHDEVNQIDFHHALLGIPTAHSTFFHRPSSSSSASLLYTLSDKFTLGTVNPKDGSLVWRQNLTQPSLPRDRAEGFLRASDGADVVVSGAGEYVTAWSAVDGKLAWDARLAGGVVKDLELLEQHDPSAATTEEKDAIVLSAESGSGIVRRLDGASGHVKWVFKDDRFDLPLTTT